MELVLTMFTSLQTMLHFLVSKNSDFEIVMFFICVIFDLKYCQKYLKFLRKCELRLHRKLVLIHTVMARLPNGRVGID